MISIDTNIVIRILTMDDPEQTEVALRTIAEPTFVAHTVLVESEWVLRSRYGFRRGQVCDLLTAILEIPTIRVADEAKVRWAIDRHRLRGDFADMVHIATSPEASTFVSFEKKLSHQAGPLAPIAIRIAC